ncbi:epoxide hydrolase [Mucilaginibacter limnophilus]|uniref:Epoxide hydrolase n=1 Tax=Mucilaginibacter limnophilus TaxID=1932778 RepID=A0A3S2UJM5_9SPHI|nr:epoxide hydrolase family protein [Mucilaginibacter limnophilus]RVT98485.1 epoxide hydrolase [Mucilaginibacter limnophilus]
MKTLEQYQFKIKIPEDDLDDLKHRLQHTKWPADPDNDDWSYGVPAGYLKDLMKYWLNEYDWRRVERSINAYKHYRIHMEGFPVHFIYQKGIGNNTIPLILTHGWPWSFWDMQKLIGPLTDPSSYGGNANDAFDVVIPSVPGYGFSTPAPSGINFWKTADVWHTLMTDILGYSKFAASGGDWGALITTQLGHKYADDLHGIHLMHTMELDQFNKERPWDVFAGHQTAERTPEEIRQQSLERMKRFVSHYAVHVLDPQTLAYGLQDSPVGLLAWLLERWRSWAQTKGGDVESVFSKEHMITTAMLYWLTGTVGSSMRFYADSAKFPWERSHDKTPLIQAPTGITFLGGENPVGVTTEQRIKAFRTGPKASLYNLHYLNAHEKGGHFGYYENPEAVLFDIRSLFRHMR